MHPSPKTLYSFIPFLPAMAEDNFTIFPILYQWYTGFSLDLKGPGYYFNRVFYAVFFLGLLHNPEDWGGMFL
jgi:hypothetical protein